MDPLTHAAAGLVIGTKTAGFSLANGLMVASTIGAVAPDFDIVARFWGDYVYLGQHRKFSHSLPGLVLIALLTGLILTPFYHTLGFWELCFWAFLGGLSHSFLDMFNSYGVSILWPVRQKKLSFNLMPIFDPVLFGLLIGLIFVRDNQTANVILAAVFGAYVIILAMIRQRASRLVQQNLKVKYPDLKLAVLPFRFPVWDFIARVPEQNIVGKVDFLKKEVRIMESLIIVRQHLGKVVLESSLGKYFRDFTPFYHIKSDLVEGKHVVQLMDLRYRVKDRFLHNATLVLDNEYNIEQAIFQPFCLTKKIYLHN